MPFVKIRSITQQEKITSYIAFILVISLFIRLVCIVSNDLLVEEAYYWNYAQHLDFSYLDHPPMVAWLIKLSTVMFGIHEWSVRFTCLICWLVMTLFSYRLTQLIRPGSERYAVLLLASLPFFFLQSMVITPDVPLLVCWSAALYYLYRAQVLVQARAWYWAGMWLGLGMLSKYTIVLLGLAIVAYLIWVPTARFWFKRKEPYLSALLALLLFTPVIYWNATHHWVSFIFQGSRRLSSLSYPHIHQFIGLLLLFMTPLGVISLWQLVRNKPVTGSTISQDSIVFIRLFTLVPLSVFALFSLNHNIKFNWIGPIVLALVPWLACQMAGLSAMRAKWLSMIAVLMVSYVVLVTMIIASPWAPIQQVLFRKFMAWERLTLQFHQIATRVAIQTNTTPIFVPLDLYPISSELSFYQAKLLADNRIATQYPIVGDHIFGFKSLMYRYWSDDRDLLGKTLILVTQQPQLFEHLAVTRFVSDVTPVQEIWSESQAQGIRLSPFYYKVVKLRLR